METRSCICMVLTRNPKVDDWRFGAGLLIGTRDEAGNALVLLGKKRPSRSLNKRRLASLGFSLHGWAIPFGQLDRADEGSFARCAIRETAQEVFGMAEDLDSAQYEACVASKFKLPSQDIAAALRPSDGWRCNVGGLVPLLDCDHRVFFLRVPYSAGTLPGCINEFPDGLRWCSFKPPNSVTVNGERLDNPWHWALEPTLDAFSTMITERP